MKLILRDVHLPLRHPFTITHGTTTLQHNLLVSLTDGAHTGYGEGASSRTHAIANVPAMREALEAVRGVIEMTDWDRPEDLWQAVSPLLRQNSFALCALDEAAHDLWGKRLGQPVWKLWGLKLENLPASNYTIGIDTIERMIAKLQEFPDWPIYKIKLGTDHDVEIVRALRQHTSAILRIDGNTAWTAEQTLRFAPELAELGVEFIEQPLRRDDWDGMKRLFAECPLPLIADESCLTEADVAKCVGHFHGINIKLTKAGGLTPARRMITQARSFGLKVMVGCMLESTVGISAIGQLLPLLDYVDMDGAVLLAEDLADGVKLDKGIASFPDRPGNGVQLTGG
jgi:L-alanine-DL-glutamate epimerase-like enolase superfamily enzyme